MAAPRIDFYHPARDIDAALQALERSVRRGEGIGLVVGSAGTGKSLLLTKLGEHLRDDFEVAILSGARICTRRALWQSVLADIGEPYRGLDEGELRINIVERVKGLASTGSGLVILVDEAHTLPTRLLEELRLLTTVPTPLPAVHVTLVGTADLEEMLGSSRMESVAQRIATRHYLEPLDHGETMEYLRTQAKVAGKTWEALFEKGCDNAVYSACDGVPRLMNQLCDQSLVIAAENGRETASAADIAAAWKDIQRLPPPTALSHAGGIEGSCMTDPLSDQDNERFPENTNDRETHEEGFPEGDIEPLTSEEGAGVIEFGDFDASFEEKACPEIPETEALDCVPVTQEKIPEPESEPTPIMISPRAEKEVDPIDGPDVEFVFDPSSDPFQEFFDEGHRVERVLMQGPDDFRSHGHVASREGAAMANELNCFEQEPASQGPKEVVESSPQVTEIDDSDMIVIEEDIHETPLADRKGVFAVSPRNYHQLFSRLRRGD